LKKTSLTLSTVSICRTPVFSIREELDNVWEELKNYIHESSPEFFRVVKEYDYASLPYLDEKARFTIWKYFNRAKFRATPYGNFAAFSLVPLLKEQQTDHIILSEKTLVHRFPNWQEKEHINFDPKFLSNHALFVRTNTTAYLCDQELRYVNIEDGSFELSAVSAEKTTLETLKFCRTQRTLGQLGDYLQHTHQLSPSLTRYFIEQLIGSQLLLTDSQPNITGTDYFSRIGHISVEKRNDYIIAERKICSGHLSEKNLHIIPELIEFLCQHLHPAKNNALNEFKAKFLRRFEEKKIPLLVAMDPEMGIGYRSLTRDKEEDPLVQDLKTYRQQRQPLNQSIDYSPIHKFLLNGMMQQKTVQLEEFREAGQQNQVMVANTLSVMLHYTDEHLIVEQIGGCTANTLLGRFSMANDEVTAIGNRFAALEQEANPDVLFFDIAYQIEKNADNINRRRAIYNYELPILSWTENGQIIDPDDILLSVKEDELVLHSVKYKKRIVPKLASAYNYVRSDLSVYRFLSDLQHQNLRSELSVNVRDMFPGLMHYQRVQYKHVVLSAEKWLIPNHICNWTDKEQSLTALAQWLAQIELKTLFKCGFSDQTLIFNPGLKEDMLSFLLFSRNKTALYIEETFISDAQLINDEQLKPYISEFIINLQHRQQIYKPYPLNQEASPLPNVKSSFLPGEEWLYFEIYCQPANSNSILLAIAEDYLKPIKKKLKNWFFIRYSDPSYHIRLRVKPRENEVATEFVANLSAVMAPYFKTGLVSDLQLKTYRREIERYGHARIDQVENCFRNNSDLILYLINKSFSVHSLYHLSILLVENVMESAGFSTKRQLGLAEQMAGLFAEEMGISSEGNKKINLGYKNFTIDSAAAHFNKSQQKRISETVKYFLKTLQKCKDTEKEKMLSDLFHMHINRLFSNDQRMHELIIYNYLTKKIKTKLGRLQQKELNKILPIS
jgi:thiopeptide-type bacteriocin biosynthesis protein